MGCPWEMMTDQTGIQTSNAPWISNQVLYPLSYLAPLWWSDKLEYRHQTAQLEEHLLDIYGGHWIKSRSGQSFFIPSSYNTKLLSYL